MTEVVTVYLLYVWMGATPIVDADDGNVTMSRGTPSFSGEYESRSRCEMDRKIFARTAEAQCVPELVTREKLHD